MNGYTAMLGEKENGNVRIFSGCERPSDDTGS